MVTTPATPQVTGKTGMGCGVASEQQAGNEHRQDTPRPRGPGDDQRGELIHQLRTITRHHTYEPTHANLPAHAIDVDVDNEDDGNTFADQSGEPVIETEGNNSVSAA